MVLLFTAQLIVVFVPVLLISMLVPLRAEGHVPLCQIDDHDPPTRPVDFCCGGAGVVPPTMLVILLVVAATCRPHC